MVVGIHIRKVGIHIGKEDPLGAPAVCSGQWGATEDRRGGPCGKQVSWVELASRQKKRDVQL